MDSEQPVKRIIRTDVVTDVVEATVTGMGEMDINPAEGLLAAELILWTLIENGLKLSPTADILQKSKLQGARVLTRISSRLEAWPAKLEDRS